MKYELIQFQCDKCGTLSPIVEECSREESNLFKVWGWTSDEYGHNHLCPECSKTQ